MAHATLDKGAYGSDWNNRLLHAIVEIQRAFIDEVDIRASCSRMLDCLLELTSSEYGFLGEVLYSEVNQPYLRAHALTDISWDKDTKKLYDENMAKGFEFHNLNSLFGVTLATGEIVISNDPKNDPRSGGLPKGHPGMRNYVGIPIKHKGEMIGMVGIANRDLGYNSDLTEALEPLLITAGSMIASVRHFQSSQKASEELKEKHKLHDGIINNISDSLIITDYSSAIKEVNSAATRIFGYHPRELIGRSITQCLDSESSEIYSALIREYILSGDAEKLSSRIEIAGLKRDGSVSPMEISVNEIKLGDSKLFVNILQDITERKAQEAKIQNANKKLKALSQTDDLSGLYNKRFFDSAFNKELNRTRKMQCDMALAVIDIDHFKRYNDAYGHLKGDQALATTGQILSDFFRRDCEFVSRIGGEEFAVIMTHMSKEECEDSLNKLMDLIRQRNIKHEHSVEDFLTVSAGLAMRGPNDTKESLFERADAALYRAKEKGRNRLETDQ